MKAIEMMTDLEAIYIVLTKKVVLCNSIDKKLFEERLSKDELESLFLIVENRFCKPHECYVITNTDMAKGLVANELLRQRESEVSGNEYDG